MPGKVNPVIAESLIQVSLWVIGADLTVTLGGLQSFFELNVGMPLIGAQMLESVHLLAAASRNFADGCVAGIEPDRARCESLVEQSLAMCTPRAPVIGYDKAALVAKTAHKNGTTLKEEAVRLGFVTEKEFDELVRPEKMIGPG